MSDSGDTEGREGLGEPVNRTDQLDPVRRLIWDRSRDLRLTLADLSRETGKNAAYFHQYMWTQRPSRLPEEVRGVIAQLLGLPEDALRGGGLSGGPAHVMPALALPGRAGLPAAAVMRDVPIYRDTDPIDPIRASDWITRPLALLPPGPLFGLWITAAHGRLQPGDLALVAQGPAPRRGDTVVVVRDKAVVAMGTLTSQAGLQATIDTDAGTVTEFDLAMARVLKVVALILG